MENHQPLEAPAPERPLVTFALFAYKQERFIREAIQGAFAQTYSPLEIILSDDCSPDRTFEIMREMTASYRGPHKIILNRNPQNLGLAGHVNLVMEMAAGELVVFAAGDDISLPRRVETLLTEWILAGKPSGIGSGLSNIDEQGKPFGPSTWAFKLSAALNNATRLQMLNLFARSPEHTVLGCTAGWSKETWNKFGGLPETIVNEDSALTFRSLLDRGIHINLEPLVLYRTHACNIWNATCPGIRYTASYYRSSEESTAKRAAKLWAMYNNSLSDLETAVSKKMIEPESATAIQKEISNKLRQLEVQSKWWNLPLSKRLSSFADSPHARFPLNVISLLPLNQHVALRRLVARIKRKMRL
jgi:glycosyltransferase involved in cell wall biosynthesis